MISSKHEANECEELILFLIENGAKVDVPDNAGQTTLQKAQEKGALYSPKFTEEMQARANTYAAAHPEKNDNKKRSR